MWGYETPFIVEMRSRFVGFWVLGGGGFCSGGLGVVLGLVVEGGCVVFVSVFLFLFLCFTFCCEISGWVFHCE